MKDLLPIIGVVGAVGWICWAIVKSRPPNLSDNPFEYFARWIRNIRLLRDSTVEYYNPLIGGPRSRAFWVVTFIWMIPMFITWREMWFGKNYFLNGCLIILSHLPWILYFLFNARKNKGCRLKLSETGINIAKGIVLTIFAFWVLTPIIYSLIDRMFFSDMSDRGSYFFPEITD